MNKNELLVKTLEQNHEVYLDILIRDIRHYMADLNEHKFRRAFHFAAVAHDGQLRKDSTPYIIHPIEAARILISLHVDEDTLIAALLHDVPEDTPHTIEEIEHKFGKKVAFLVDGITKLSKVHYQHDMAKRQIESLKKLFIHTAQDPRIILIKLADRLHNMRTLHYLDKPEKQLRIARETFEIFVPIANLLGIQEIKSELEDLCFKYLFPDEYENLSDRTKRNREKNQKIMEETVQTVEQELRRQKIFATVYGRQRNLYSVYKKIVFQGKRFDDFDDTIALRILVQEKDDCYKVLGILHSLFKPKPQKFKDYIAVPKMNGYQSLHTTVFGLQGMTTEFQIRTNHMHLEAEYGITAHYFSKHKNQRHILEEDKRAYWAAKILQLQKEESDPSFMEDLKLDIFHDRIFVFTPKGDAIDLPQDATCIDFAYVIHTQVGHRALKADINGELVPLSTKLQNGDTVRIIASDLPKGPSRSWLTFIKTSTAKSRIREYFKKTSREDKLATGKLLLQKEFDRAGLGLVKNIHQKKLKIFLKRHSDYRSLDDLLVAIGEGGFSSLGFIKEMYPDQYQSGGASLGFFEKNPKKQDTKTLTHIAVKVISRDMVGQLQRILKAFSDLRIDSIKTKAYRSFWSGNFICKQTAIVRNYADVSQLFEHLEQIEGVKKVERLFLGKKLLFIVGSMLTFCFWAVHPVILYYFTNTGVATPFPSIITFAGALMLLFLIFSLKSLTQRSFPELRESKAFWITGYILSTFALITLFSEIYFFKISFNWVFVFAFILFIYAYLTAEYINNRERI